METQAQKIEKQERRRELAKKLPSLASRVLSLAGKAYPGSGFHYSLAKSIGYLLWKVNDHDLPFTLEALLSLEVIYEGICEDVLEAEKYVLEQKITVHSQWKDGRRVWVVTDVTMLAEQNFFHLKLVKGKHRFGVHWVVEGFWFEDKKEVEKPS